MAGSFMRLTISRRIHGINLIAALGFLVVFWIGSQSIETSLFSSREEMTRRLVETAVSTVNHYQRLAQAGVMSTEEAQKAALSLLQDVRYDKEQYFWVNDMAGKMLMHPTSSKLVNTSILELKDAHGSKIFADMIDLVRAQGGGSYRYYWPPSGEAPRLKLSHVGGVPEWGWVIGSGVYVDDVMAEVRKAQKQLGLAILCVLVVAALIASLIGRSISRPVQSLTHTMGRLAAGDLSVSVNLGKRRDEIGEMAQAVGVFHENALMVERMKEEQARRDGEAALNKKRDMDRLATEFEQSVGGFVGLVASAATAMQLSAENLSGLADRTSKQSSLVSGATERATMSVQTVASATEEMSASIGEISRQVQDAARISGVAVAEVAKTDATVSSLSEAAAQIGDVVKLIQDIASQTNLLALNATIEAARAGEAGKGFAVVASEVKNLATQTGRATEEISSKIGTVQGVSGEAVQAIRNIGKTIEQVSQIAGTISSAIQQQNMATREISSSVQQAAAGTSEVSQSIGNVTSAASESRTAASDVLQAAADLSQQSERLRDEITNYLTKIRAS